MRKLYFLIILLTFINNTVVSQYGWYLQNSGTTSKLNSLSVVYPNTYLWAAGDNGKIIATTNSGANWITQNSGTFNNLNSIHFVTTQKGFAAGNNGTILRTTNGGNSWVAVNSGINTDLYAVSFDFYVWADSVYTAFAAGKNGVIVKTTNLGNNWFISNSGTTKDLKSIYPDNEGSIWIAGSDGTILKSDDGGNAWTILNSGITTLLNDVQPLYSNGIRFGGLAAGNNGVIIRSGNLGTSWESVNSGTSSNLFSMTPQYYLNIWISGTNGTVIKTGDLGNTWTNDPAPTSSNLNSIKFLDLNTGWAVGDNGVIVHTTTDNWAIDSRIMDANSISTWFSNSGIFNQRIINNSITAGFEWPKGQNHFPRFSSGLWIGAAIGIDTLATVANYWTYQYVPGYTDNNGVLHGSNDPLYRMYNLTYGINDSDRQYWPNSLLGNSDQGAPVYFDTVANTWKPLDIGDQTMFYSYSDNYAYLHVNYSQPLKADIKQLNFSFTAQGVMSNTLYSQYTIINRSVNIWNNTYITFWTDDDVGNSQDDRTGCDTAKQIGFTYNGQNSDTAYGSTPPAVSFNLIKGPIEFTGNNYDTAFICKGKIRQIKVGYKELGLSVFNTYANGIDPLNVMGYYHYMEGLDINGNPIIDPLTGAKTKFVFSGDPETNTGWVQNNIADMRFLISVGPLKMNPGDTQVIVVAQVVARGNSNLNSVTLLKQYAQVVKDNYKNCFINVPIGITKISNNVPNKFALFQNYPNPFNPKTSINYQLPVTNFVKIVLYDVLGKEVEVLVNEKQNAGIYQVEWDGSKYPSGVYFYRITSGDFTKVKKMVLVK